MNGYAIQPLTGQLSSAANAAYNQVKSIAIEQVYNHRTVVEIEIAGYQILNTLLEIIGFAMIDQKSKYSKKVLQLIPDSILLPSFSLLKVDGYIGFCFGNDDVYIRNVPTFKGISIQE